MPSLGIDEKALCSLITFAPFFVRVSADCRPSAALSSSRMKLLERTERKWCSRIYLALRAPPRHRRKPSDHARRARGEAGVGARTTKKSETKCEEDVMAPTERGVGRRRSGGEKFQVIRSSCHITKPKSGNDNGFFYETSIRRRVSNR